MAYLDRDGARIYYQAFGLPGGATPLLLTHGFSASSAMWQPNIAALAAARLVITWDLRGHGSSDAPDDLARYSAEACVADMAALLDACGVARVVAGGLSGPDVGSLIGLWAVCFLISAGGVALLYKAFH